MFICKNSYMKNAYSLKLYLKAQIKKMTTSMYLIQTLI